MKIASWNVNSLKVRLPQVINWLQQHQPDVLGLQETKLVDENFPAAAINEVGYEVVYSGQKTYNGMALITKSSCKDIVTDIPGLDDHQRRILMATVNDIRIINLYVPNGESTDSEKYIYKLNWLAKVTEQLKIELKNHEKVLVMGDYNIAPSDADVKEPEKWQGKVLCSDKERAAFHTILELGFKDSFRLFEQPPNCFSWWDYRMLAFRRNRGLRIDHILLNVPLANLCKASYIDKEPRKLERPSDHAPVVVDIEGYS